MGIDISFVDSTNLENVEKALKPNTKVGAIAVLTPAFIL